MSKLGHRPALDGLRGIAVASVVIGHSFGWPPDGVFGVDLFFVLSGFLITTLLLEEQAANGAISLGGFYLRRARRLLPALFLLLAIYALVTEASGGRALAPVLAAVFYVTNLAVEGGQLTPISHLWSLAQEEQFYLVWPLVLALLLRRRAWILPFALAGFVVAEWAFRDTIGMHSPHGFYGPTTRSDGLALGCLAAVIWSRDRRRLTDASRAVAIVALPLVVLIVVFTRESRFTTAALLPLFNIYFVALVVYGVEVAPKALTFRPLRELGRISYSLYLWHVPVLYWLGTGFILGRTLRVDRSLLAIALSVLLASLSTVLVEAPIRRWRRPPRATMEPIRATSL
jgi:peptidoglycan/LPS O-acetylase OafA/YrhL